MGHEVLWLEPLDKRMGDHAVLAQIAHRVPAVDAVARGEKGFELREVLVRRAPCTDFVRAREGG